MRATGSAASAASSAAAASSAEGSSAAASSADAAPAGSTGCAAPTADGVRRRLSRGAEPVVRLRLSGDTTTGAATPVLIRRDDVADVHRIHAGLFGQDQRQPVSNMDEVHPPLKPGLPRCSAFQNCGAGLPEDGLAQAHALGRPLQVFHGVQEQGRDACIPTFPTHELVVVHFGENVVVAEPLCVFVELLAPADQHWLERCLRVQHRFRVREGSGPLAGQGLRIAL